MRDEVKFIFEIGLLQSYFGCNVMMVREYVQKKTHVYEASVGVHGMYVIYIVRVKSLDTPSQSFFFIFSSPTL